MISINNYSEALKLAAWAMFEQYTSDVGTFIFGYMEEVNNKQDYPIILAVRGEFPLIAVDEKAVKITQKMVIGKKPIGKNPNIDIDLLQEYAIYFMRAINTLDKMRVSNIHAPARMIATPKGFTPDDSVWITFDIQIDVLGCLDIPLPVPGGFPAPGTTYPAAQIQSDWGQADDGVVDFIKNKPTLGTAAAKDVGTGADEVAAGNHTHSALHSHSNKSTLDKIGESGGVPTWDGSAWPGGGAAADQKIVFGTEITGNADITATSHKFKTTDVNKSTAVTLRLQKNVFAVGEWFVLVQTGDGQFELDCDAEVTVPDWNKSAGKGFEMYVYCVDATTDANVFRIVGGVE
jgi:hypothetical protein